MPGKKKDRQFVTPKIQHDLPLERDENADFNFDAFAKTLARLIASIETRTPLVIGVSGAWGSGKTTLLRRIESMLKDGGDYFEAGEQDQFRACKTVWFDAWKYQGETELLVALVRRILQEMQRGGLGDKFKAILAREEVGQGYDLVEMFINAFQFKFGGLGAELQVKLDPQKHRIESPFETNTAFFDYFEAAFENLLALWVHGLNAEYSQISDGKGALVVFIDDLDRCLPAKTVQVLEAIKLFLDKKGCIFVLGADADRVRGAVKEHYQSFSEHESAEYLEKIIQLRFNLPAVPDAEMGKYVEYQSADPQFARHWQVISAGAELNPRKVKTFLNDINLAWALLYNTGKAHDAIKDDFVRWQALMRAATLDFRNKVLEFDDHDLRFQFVQDALKWAGGGQEAENLKSYFADYDKVPRLRRTLRAIGAFSPAFDAGALDDFMHLSAPAAKEEPKPAPEPPASQKTPAQAKEAEREPESFEVGLPAEPEQVETTKGVTRGGGVGWELAPEGGAIPPHARPSREGAIVVKDMEFMLIPKGKFIMGSKDDDKDAFDNERPQHTVEIPYDYWLARFTVTNEQFGQFIKASGYKTTAEQQGSAYGFTGSKWEDIKGANWLHPRGPKSGIQDRADHPVVSLSWLDALEYVKWLSADRQPEMAQLLAAFNIQPSTLALRLPTEAEWEKAARGVYGNIYPWGNEFEKTRCNSGESGKMDTVPVGAFPNGASPYGCEQMSGNVWEWTHSLFEKYPYAPDARRENETDKNSSRVLRGGSFFYNRQYARAAVRNRSSPNFRYGYFGFRAALAPHLS